MVDMTDEIRYLPEVDMVAIRMHDQHGGWLVMPRSEYEKEATR
jgi:hypothetical protein